MWGFQQGSRLLATLRWTPRVPRALIASRPPKHQLSVAEQVIAFSAMSGCCLLPAAWILAHVEHYKSRPE